MQLGYEEVNMDLNRDSTTGLPPVSDDDSDGFVDGSPTTNSLTQVT